MAELWNLLVTESTEHEALMEWMAEALAARGWATCAAEDSGAHTATFWKAGSFAVASLDDWEGVDLELAKEVAQRAERPVAVSYVDGAGEVQTFALYASDGKKTKRAGTPLGAYASRKAANLTPEGPAIQRAFAAPLEGATLGIEAQLRTWIRPILEPLGFRRTKVSVRYHPSIDAVVAWARPHPAGGRVLVRYDFARSDRLHGCTQRVMHEIGDSAVELSKTECESGVCKWDLDPTFVERDFEMFAAFLARALLDALPGDTPLLDRHRALASRADELRASFPIGKVLDLGEVPVKLVFRGAQLVTVRSAEGQQITLRMDMSAAPMSDDVALGDFVALRNGEVRPRRLRIGAATFRFDERGQRIG